MNIIGDALRWVMIGGRKYPEDISKVISGEMQARYAIRKKGDSPELFAHPDYLFATIAHTQNAIRGAFTLRLIGTNGISMDDLEERTNSTDIVHNLEHLGGDPVTYKILGVQSAAHLLKLTKVITITNDYSPL
ncbi:MAG: hypothetical protein WCO19_05455 [Candidatus Saccharibacteria bacterium]